MKFEFFFVSLGVPLSPVDTSFPRPKQFFFHFLKKNVNITRGDIATSSPGVVKGTRTGAPLARGQPYSSSRNGSMISLKRKIKVTKNFLFKIHLSKKNCLRPAQSEICTNSAQTRGVLAWESAKMKRLRSGVVAGRFCKSTGLFLMKFERVVALRCDDVDSAPTHTNRAHVIHTQSSALQWPVLSLFIFGPSTSQASYLLKSINMSLSLKIRT